MNDFLLFTVDRRRYALNLAAVRRVVRMVDVTPLPEAPVQVSGVVNWGGEVVPVLDLRRVIGAAPRPYDPADHLLIADAGGRTVALAIDAAEGVQSLADEGIVSLDGVVPGATMSEEIATVAGEIVLIWDLGRFLAGTEVAREGAGDPAS